MTDHEERLARLEQQVEELLVTWVVADDDGADLADDGGLDLADDDDEMEGGIGLAELLAELGGELRKARREAQRLPDATLKWSEAFVELEVNCQRTKKGRISFRIFSVAEAGVGGDSARGKSMRLKVHVVPASSGATVAARKP